MRIKSRPYKVKVVKSLPYKCTADFIFERLIAGIIGFDLDEIKNKLTSKIRCSNDALKSVYTF